MLRHHDPLNVIIKAFNNYFGGLCILIRILDRCFSQDVLCLFHPLIVTLLTLFELRLEFTVLFDLFLFFLLLCSYLGINLLFPLLVTIKE